jgi:phage-related holin
MAPERKAGDGMVQNIMESPRLIMLAMVDYTSKAASGWYYKLLASPVFIAYGHLFGGDGYVLVAFCIVLLVDLFVGMARAVKNKCFQFRRLNLWLVKLVSYALCLGVVGVLNGAAEHGWGVNIPMLDTVLIILIASEAISIFENLHEIGCYVPPVLLRLAAGVKVKAGRKLDQILDNDEQEGTK